MADENIVTNIVANADFSGLIADVNRITASLSKLQAQIIASDAKLANQVSVMNRSFGENLRRTGQFSTHFVTLTSDVEKFGKNLDSGQLKLKNYFQTFQQHTKTQGGLIRELAKQQVALQNAIVQPLGKNAQGLMQYSVHIPQGLDAVKNKTALARQELQIMNKVIQDGGVQLINWGKNTQWAGRQLTVGLTVPLAAFGMAAAKSFREADAELTRLTKVYGGIAATSSSDLKKVRDEVSATAKELSRSYGSSFKDTISLAADIAATGKTGNELLGSVKETTRLAVLGEVDRQDAMKATLAIQNAFKQNTEQLTESINFLNAVENQTSTSLGDLIEAIPKAGPVVQALGGSIKDLSLYLTAMKEGGVNASEGANALKSALASLINPTKVATDMFSSLGINLKGIVNDNAGNLTGTILELQSALDNLNPLQKQQAIEQLFGKFQFARMNALFANLGKQGSQTLQVMDLMKASSQDLANVASRELGLVTESASGKYKRAIESLKSDLAGIGEEFLKVQTFFLNVTDSIVKFINKLPGPVKTILTFVTGLTAVIGPIIMLTGVLANFFGYIIKGASHFKSLFKGGEGWKMLTPEILAASKAGTLIESTFYNDAKAATVLKTAIEGLIAEFTILEQKALAGQISVAPAFSTMGGTTVVAGGRQVNPNHPLLSPQDTRSMSHMNPVAGMTTDQRSAQTIFGVVPGAPKVNQKIGNNPQMYAEGDLPKIPGLTSIGGASTGVVAQEAAKWHAMTGALAMQSDAEIKLLKQEVSRTGLITNELSASYQALLPSMTNLIGNAAKESAVIVADLQAGKLTVDQARTKIIALNTQVEGMLAGAAVDIAGQQGRSINLTSVPLLNQPVVNKSGKSNMKELSRPGRTRNLLNQIAQGLGVKTFGAPYSTETTIPKRLNSGNIVPGTGNTDTVPAMLTPGEFVVNKKATAANLPLLHAINGGKGSDGPGYDIGGQIRLERSHVAEGSASDLNKVRAKRGYANTVSVGKGIPIWMTRDANQETRSVGKGMTGPELVKEFRKAINAGHHPFEPWMTASDDLGGNPKNKVQLNKVFNEMLGKLEKDNRVFGGKNGEMTFEKWFQKEVIASKSFSDIKVGSRSFKSIFNSVLQPMGPRDGKTIAALETLIKSKDGLKTIENSKLSGVAKGILGTFSGSSYNASRRNLAKFMAKAFLRRNSGGIINSNLFMAKNPNMFASATKEQMGWRNWAKDGVGPDLHRALAKKFEAYPNGQMPTTYDPAKPAGKYPMPHSYYQDILNADPLHGPLQIGRYQPPMHIRNQLQGARIRYTGTGYHKADAAPAFAIGDIESRAKAALFNYMQGDYAAINDPAVQAYLSTIRTKFTGTLHRGVRNPSSLPPVISKLIQEGKWPELVGKEFIMRRASWSKNKDTAEGFGQLQMVASVKNRNAVPASEIFPDLTFQSASGPVKVNESEVYMGGKFRVVAASKNKLKLQAVIDGKREMGGSVGAGKSYLVGEKGPELFVPRNSGGIIPNHNIGGMVPGYRSGGQVKGYSIGGQVAGMGLGMLGSMAGQSIGQGLGGNIGGTMGSMAGFMLPGMFMGGRGGADVDVSGKLEKSIFANKKFGQSLAGTVFQGNKLTSSLSKIALGLTKFNLVTGVAVGVAAGLYTAYKKHQEQLKLNALGYGLTAEAAQKAGLKYVDYNQKIKDSIQRSKDMMEANKLAYQSMTSAGIPIKMTITEYGKLKEEVKGAYSEQIKLINSTKKADLGDLATRFKEQFVAAGMSAEEATKKIYAMFALSKQSSSAAMATVGNRDFNAIQDARGAAAGSLKSYDTATRLGEAKSQAAALNSALGAIDAGITDIMKKNEEAVKKDKTGHTKKIDNYQAELDMMKYLQSNQYRQTKLTQATIDEMAKANPAIKEIANNSDTVVSVWQKLRLQAAGLAGDLSKLNSDQVSALYNLSNAISKSVIDNNKGTKDKPGLLADEYSKLNTLQKRRDDAAKAAAGQSVKAQIDSKQRLKDLQSQIDATNKLADSRIKALDASKAEADLNREMQSAKLELQFAESTGNTQQAAQARLRYQSALQSIQTEGQKKSIVAAADKANAAPLAEIEKINNANEKLSNAAALAGDNIAKLDKQILALTTTIDGLNNTQTAYNLNLVKFIDDQAAKGIVATKQDFDKTATGKYLSSGLVEPTKAAGGTITTGEKVTGARRNRDGSPSTFAPPKTPGAQASDLAVKGITTGGDIVAGKLIINGKDSKDYMAASAAANIKVTNTYGSGGRAGSYITTSTIKSSDLIAAGMDGNPKVGSKINISGTDYIIKGSADRSGTIKVQKAGMGWGNIDPKIPTVVGDMGPELLYNNMVIPNISSMPFASPSYNVPSAAKQLSSSGSNSSNSNVVVNQSFYQAPGENTDAFMRKVTQATVAAIGKDAKISRSQVGESRSI